MLNRINHLKLTEEEKIWLAIQAAGAVLADGEIKEVQLKELGKYFNLMKATDEPSLAAKETLMLVSPPRQKALNADSKKSIELFKIILKVITPDFVLCDREVAFILQSARLLNLNQSQAKPLIDDAVEFIRFEYFLRLLDKLEKEQRHWLSAVIIKMIYADNKVTSYERAYLNHITQLLDNDVNALHHLKTTSEKEPLPMLKKNSFKFSLQKKTFKYLIEIALQGQSLEKEAVAVGRDAGLQMGLSEGEMDRITKEVLHILPLL